jgi:hypothetical protein
MNNEASKSPTEPIPELLLIADISSEFDEHSPDEEESDDLNDFESCFRPSSTLAEVEASVQAAEQAKIAAQEEIAAPAQEARRQRPNAAPQKSQCCLLL